MHPESTSKLRLHPRNSHLSSCRPFSFVLVSRVLSLSLFLLRGASRGDTHMYVCTYTIHVHARDARRAKRRAKESAPRRSELSRSHGSSSGSGGDIPTYLPIGLVALEPACRKRLSVSFSHLYLSFSLSPPLSHSLVTSVYFSYSTLFFHLRRHTAL